MGFVTPFTTFDDEKYQANNALITASNEYIASGKTPVSWNFSTIPSEKWKDDLGSALLIYAQKGQGDEQWADVEKAFVQGWKDEYAAAKADIANKEAADDGEAETADNAEETAE